MEPRSLGSSKQHQTQVELRGSQGLGLGDLPKQPQFSHVSPVQPLWPPCGASGNEPEAAPWRGGPEPVRPAAPRLSSVPRAGCGALAPLAAFSKHLGLRWPLLGGLAAEQEAELCSSR